MKPTRRELGVQAASLFAASALSSAAEASPTGGGSKSAKAGGKRAWTKIGPGIWRLRLGKPEEITPLRNRSTEMRLEGLRQMTPCDQPPFDPRALAFDATGRGCAVEIPIVAWKTKD